MRTMKRWVGMTLGLAAMACGDDSELGGAGGTGGAGGVASDGGAGGAGAGGTADCSGTQTDDPQLAAAMDELRVQLIEANAPGGAIAIVQNGQLLHLGVAGTTQAGVCDPVTADTPFLLPYAKFITSLAALDAVEDGLLELNQPINQVVPLVVEEGAQYADDITLHHLLTSTSNYTTLADAQPQDSVCMGLEEWYSDPTDPMIEAPPGSMADGEDRANLELAAWMLETVDGAPFADVIRTRVMEPLGMGGAFDEECPNHQASYGFRASMNDYVKLAQYLTAPAGEILAPAMFDTWLAESGKTFWSNEYAAYFGRGLRLTPERVLYEGGGTSSFGTFSQELVLFPDRGLAIMTVMNVDATGPVEAVNMELARIFVDSEFELFPAEPDLDAAAVQALAGTYVDAIGFQGSGLRTLDVRPSANDPAVLEADYTEEGTEAVTASLERFYGAYNFEVEGRIVRFWLDDQGAPTALSEVGYHGPPFFFQPE